MMKALFHDRSCLDRGKPYIYDIASRYGITDLEVIKTRSDSKIIAKGNHGDWGAVALKTVDPIANPGRAYSDRILNQLVIDSSSSIFPEVHVVGDGYSVCEWVEGGEIGRMDSDTLKGLPFVEFADAVRAWGASTSDGSLLSPHEIKSLIKFYVQVTIRRMLYRSAYRCVASCATFLVRKTEIRGYLETMAHLSPELQLERSMMLSDLHIENALYDHAKRKFVVVDFEAIRPGNVMFDAVFYLAFLIVKKAPTEVTQQLAAHVFSPEVIVSEEGRRFFKAMGQYVVATYMIIDGHGPREVENGLNIIAAG